ncbi:MAG: hypothetical protein H7Z40_19085 [Phycisphaerae bacterium]|nr:hypothetical protein [Gemmatimonadaceae bacterium]
MSPAAVALQFSAPDLIDAEWGEEEQLAAAGAMVGQSERKREALEKGLRIGQADGSPTSLATLKAEVAMVVAGGRGAGPAWSTGVALLDEALGGGVPRGRVTEVVGPLGAGKTSLVRQLVRQVLAEGGWVAWVDATRTLAPQELAGLGERLIVVRPRDYTRGAWCADLLLRSGVFSLVVLDGAPVLSRTLGVRLSQLARERDAAFVVLRDGTQGSRLGGAVRLQVRPIAQAKVKTSVPMSMKKNPASMLLPASASAVAQQAVTNARKFSVLVEKGGAYRTVEVTCAIVVARRVCTDTEIPDRRGVARRTRTIAGVGPEHAAAEHAAAHESVRAQFVVQSSASSEHFAERSRAAAGEHTTASVPQSATDTSVSRQHTSDGSWTGRGRPRMAESSYGRATRRGKARQFLSNKQHAREYTEPNGQQPQQPAETDHQSHARRESRRQSQRELQKYARSLG